METAQAQSRSPEEEVRQAIAASLTANGGQVEQNQPGLLVIDVGGSVGGAFLAGPFRKADKMPVRITVQTTGGDHGTGIGIQAGSHGTGGGYMSGGVFGVAKSRKAAKVWLDFALQSVPNRVDSPPSFQG